MPCFRMLALTLHISRPAAVAFSMQQKRYRGVRLHVLVRRKLLCCLPLGNYPDSPLHDNAPHQPAQREKQNQDGQRPVTILTGEENYI